MSDPAGAAVTPIDAADEAASVRLAAADDRPALGAALADGFHDDPCLSWVVRDDAIRLERLTRGFNLFHRQFWGASDLTYTTRAVAGACVWLGPGEDKVGALDQFRSLPGMLRAFGMGDTVRLMRMLNVMESNHPHDAEHYYLPVIAVSRPWQGRGLGSALMKPMLDRCDREGMPAYLEATTERSRALYARHGFELRGEIHCPGGGPPMWPMWREPARA